MHWHVHTFDAQARRYDPTGTGDIRSRFRGELAKRWRKLRELVKQAIVSDNHNLLGLGPMGVGSIRANPVGEFQAWLDAALGQVVLDGKGEWTQHYLDEAAARARSRAYQLVPAQPGGQIEHSQPVVAASAAVELQGVVETVSQRIMRIVSHGLLGKLRGPKIAQAAAREVRVVGQVRSMAMAEMSVNQAFNHATLDAFKALGLKKVGTQAEYVPPGTRIAKLARDARRRSNTTEIVEVLTAGDDLVCEDCQDISDEGPYEIGEARDLIPAHPNCRCAFVPFFDERFAKRE